FLSRRRRHTRFSRDWSSDVCSSDLAASAGLIDGPTNAIFTATVIVSMVLTPFGMIALRFFMPKHVQSMEGVEAPDGLSGRVLIKIGRASCRERWSQTVVVVTSNKR